MSTVDEWNKIIPHLFEDNSGNLLDESIKSISLFGLNKAILNHCGIELDRTESSASFALNVLTFVRKLIEEKNESENDFYILTQAHNDRYLTDCFFNEIPNQGKRVNFYSSKIIRDTSSLTLVKKISLFKKFEEIMNGGSLFDQKINTRDISLNDYLKVLTDSKINAFSLRNFENGVILR